MVGRKEYLRQDKRLIFNPRTLDASAMNSLRELNGVDIRYFFYIFRGVV